VSYEVEFAPAAARAFKKLPAAERTRIRTALVKLAEDAAIPGRIGGKRVKSIKGTSDAFHRLRVGDHRIMYDVLEDHDVLLILGVVHRGDLERWLRTR
jgi:mRNA interferase RelE/StbE